MTGTFDDLLWVAAVILLVPAAIGGIAALLAWRELRHERPAVDAPLSKHRRQDAIDHAAM